MDAPKNHAQPTSPEFSTNWKRLIAVSTVILLAACSKPAEKTEDIRPVRTIQLSADNVDVVAEFAGEVRARIESRLGFRVGGKIVARKVDISCAGLLATLRQSLLARRPALPKIAADGRKIQ